MKLRTWETVLIIFISLFLIAGTVAGTDAEELSGKIVRLHVVANSDTEADQALKLRVRDSVLAHLGTVLSGATDRDEAEELIRENLPEITRRASDVVGEAGFEYAVRASVLFEDFPTTDYDTFSLPAGEYLSLRVTIGSGAGHNWWCVVFPPVCTAASTDEMAAVGLTDSEVSLITRSSGDYVVKFRVMEIWAFLKGLWK